MKMRGVWIVQVSVAAHPITGEAIVYAVSENGKVTGKHWTSRWSWWRRAMDRVDVTTATETPAAYELRVWLAAVAEAEKEVLRLTPAAPGGFRRGLETIEEYVGRSRAEQDAALARVRLARGKVEALQGPPQGQQP